jgi:hypothetical protein
MADPGTQALKNGPEILSGAAIPFRFEVTWRSLTRPLSPAGVAAPVSKLSRRAPAADAEPKEWEMVLPRMQRPATGAVRDAVVPAEELTAPSFATTGERGSRRWMLVAAALLLPLAFAAVRWTGHSAPSDETAAAGAHVGGTGWISEWASDPTGSARGRQIALYRPSISMSDYRLDFVGSIERMSLGWVFRAADSRNYYVGKVEATGGSFAVTRFAVIGGVEGPHIQRPLALTAGVGKMLKVRLDASGPRFTIYVQNQVVDDWQDERLKTGGVGFVNEREERGQVGTVQISFPKGGRQ